MSAAINQARETALQLECVHANGMTPLMHAVCDDSLDVVRALLDCGEDVNAKRNDGFTALALAAFFGRTAIVELLLQRGADVRAVTRFGTSPEMWANARGYQEIVDLLRDVPEPVVTSDKHVSHAAPLSAVSKALPEIHDLPPVIGQAFHPGHAFIARVSSDRRSLVALTAALIVTFSLVIFATYQIKGLLRNDSKQAASIENNLVVQPQAAVVQPDQIEPVPQEPGGNQNENKPVPQEPAGNQAVTVDLPNKAAPGPSEGSTTSAAVVKPSIKTISTPRLSHSSLSKVRRDVAIRSEPLKQPAEPEIESKPAPLTVEVSHDRDTNTRSATHTVDPPRSQSAPLGITSSKPRTKVIQWP